MGVRVRLSKEERSQIRRALGLPVAAKEAIVGTPDGVFSLRNGKLAKTTIDYVSEYLRDKRKAWVLEGRSLKPFDLYHDWWYAKRQRLAAQNPEWAEIEARRIVPGSTSKVFLSEEHNLTMEDWERQHEIAESVCPHTWVHKLHWWMERHGPSVQRRRLRADWQRSQRGFADRDLWSFDRYLASLLADALERLRDAAHAYPCESSPEEWRATLTKMAEGFRSLTDDDAVGGDEYQALEARKDEAFDLLKKWFFALWD